MELHEQINYYVLAIASINNTNLLFSVLYYMH